MAAVTERGERNRHQYEGSSPRRLRYKKTKPANQELPLTEGARHTGGKDRACGAKGKFDTLRRGELRTAKWSRETSDANKTTNAKE